MKNLDKMLEEAGIHELNYDYARSNRYYRKYLDRKRFATRYHSDSCLRGAYKRDDGAICHYYASRYSVYYRHQSNKRIRNYKLDISNGNYCHKLYDYVCMMW